MSSGDLADLRRAFKGDIVVPGDAGYEQAIQRWALNAVRRARIVAYVRDAADVGAALRYARAHGVKIAVHGGGHSPNGASSSEDGLVVDLSRYLNTVRVDPAQRRAYVGGGATWAAVNKATMEHGLAMVGGTVSHTGVGGLTVGGGYGWLSPMHGLTIDHLRRATVVTADGSVRTASADENADLFWGIRGGGSNFGVVTEFVFQLHPQRTTVFAGPLVFMRDKVAAVARAIDAWFPTAGPKQALHAVMGPTPDGTPALTLLAFYNGTEEEGREALKTITDLGPVADMRKEITYVELNSMMDPFTPPGKCCWMRGVLVDDALKVITLENFDKVMELLKGTPFRGQLAFEYLPHGKINSVAPHETPYRRNLPGNGIAVVMWDEHTPELEARARTLVEQLTAMVKVPGMHYGNFSSDTEALPTAEGIVKPTRAQELFGEHYPRLQQIKGKYDPDMMFNKWFVVHPVAA